MSSSTRQMIYEAKLAASREAERRWREQHPEGRFICYKCRPGGYDNGYYGLDAMGWDDMRGGPTFVAGVSVETHGFSAIRDRRGLRIRGGCRSGCGVTKAFWSLDKCLNYAHKIGLDMELINLFLAEYRKRRP